MRTCNSCFEKYGPEDEGSPTGQDPGTATQPLALDPVVLRIIGSGPAAARVILHPVDKDLRLAPQGLCKLIDPRNKEKKKHNL